MNNSFYVLFECIDTGLPLLVLQAAAFASSRLSFAARVRDTSRYNATLGG
jgi:hypothetical protein